MKASIHHGFHILRQNESTCTNIKLTIIINLHIFQIHVPWIQTSSYKMSKHDRHCIHKNCEYKHHTLHTNCHTDAQTNNKMDSIHSKFTKHFYMLTEIYTCTMYVTLSHCTCTFNHSLKTY